MSDRTLTGGIPIPGWMRSSGFDPSTLSPPTYDDDFMQIRHDKRGSSIMGPGGGCRAASEQPEPSKNRPHGVDDGFHGLKSECASDVVSCAHRILGVPVSYHRQRRNSKSLPASPLVAPRPPGSPETRRRLANRFFTLEENKETCGSTSSLLDAISRDPVIRAKTTLHETPAAPEIIRPQPSEYREMNFWSPTSM